MIKFGMFENSCPNPLVNPANNDKSKLVVMNSAGTAGINMFPAPNPKAVKITPIIAVITNPKILQQALFLHIILK